MQEYAPETMPKWLRIQADGWQISSPPARSMKETRPIGCDGGGDRLPFEEAPREHHWHALIPVKGPLAVFRSLVYPSILVVGHPMEL